MKPCVFPIIVDLLIIYSLGINFVQSYMYKFILYNGNYYNFSKVYKYFILKIKFGNLITCTTLLLGITYFIS